MDRIIKENAMKLLFTISTVLGIYLTIAPTDHKIIPCDDGDSGSETQCTIIEE